MMQLIRAAVVLPAAMLFSSSTMVAAQPPIPARVRDSAGVRIMEHSTIKTSVPAFRIGAQLANVGGLRDNIDEEIEGTGYTVATRFTDGRVAVAENYTVRILNPQGKFVRLLGGRGGGPGQFNSQIGGMCRLRDDTLVVWGGGRRVSYFDAAGTHVRSFVSDGYIAGKGCAADGSLLARAPGPNPYRGRTPQELAGLQQYAVLKRLTPDGRLGDSIGTFPAEIGAMPYKVVQDALWTAMHGDQVYVGNGSTTEIAIVSMSGKLTGIIRWHDTLPRLTQSMIDEMIVRSRATLRTPDGDVSVGDLVRSARHRALMPAYGGLLVDGAGRLWVRDDSNLWRPTAGRLQPGWTVFAADGSLLGRFELPEIPGGGHVTVTEAGADYVVLRASSREEGVRVIVLSIERPTG